MRRRVGQVLTKGLKGALGRRGIFIRYPRPDEELQDPRELVMHGDFAGNLQAVAGSITSKLRQRFIDEYGEYSPQKREEFFSKLNNGSLFDLFGYDATILGQLSGALNGSKYAMSYERCPVTRLKVRLDVLDGTIDGSNKPSRPHSHYLGLSSGMLMRGFLVDFFYLQDPKQPGIVEATNILWRGPGSVVGDWKNTLDGLLMIHSQFPFGEETVYTHIYASEGPRNMRTRTTVKGEEIVREALGPGMFKVFTPSEQTTKMILDLYRGNITSPKELEKTYGIPSRFQCCTADGVEERLWQRSEESKSKNHDRGGRG